jgi:hypothetical protein
MIWDFLVTRNCLDVPGERIAPEFMLFPLPFEETAVMA